MSSTHDAQDCQSAEGHRLLNFTPMYALTGRGVWSLATLYGQNKLYDHDSTSEQIRGCKAVSWYGFWA